MALDLVSSQKLGYLVSIYKLGWLYIDLGKFSSFWEGSSLILELQLEFFNQLLPIDPLARSVELPPRIVLLNLLTNVLLPLSPGNEINHMELTLWLLHCGVIYLSLLGTRLYGFGLIYLHPGFCFRVVDLRLFVAPVEVIQLLTSS